MKWTKEIVIKTLLEDPRKFAEPIHRIAFEKGITGDHDYRQWTGCDKNPKNWETWIKSFIHLNGILDEILKGTNSKDKEIGSAKFLQKLKRLNSKGIIATHDLSLCDLAINDSSFKNMCFDSIINGDSLTFDYKINEGICKNMNASFLLKQMKLVD